MIDGLYKTRGAFGLGLTIEITDSTGEMHSPYFNFFRFKAKLGRYQYTKSFSFYKRNVDKKAHKAAMEEGKRKDAEQSILRNAQIQEDIASGRFKERMKSVIASMPPFKMPEPDPFIKPKKEKRTVKISVKRPHDSP